MSYFKNLIHIQARQDSCSDGAQQKIFASRVLNFLVLIYGFFTLLQSSVLSVTKVKTTTVSLCSGIFLSYVLQKQLYYTFCRTLH